METDRARLVHLWKKAASGSRDQVEHDLPTLSVFGPRNGKGRGSAVLIFPGGGYSRLALAHEGEEIAEWLVSLGVTACLVRYRCAPKYQFPIPLVDAQRAVRVVRSHAQEWKIKPDQIGIIGFSAGGHLASCAGTHFDAGKSDAGDPIERVSCRPDFMVLCYPLISMHEPYTHVESRENLLGANPDPASVSYLSNENQVSKDTPPAFIFHSVADDVIPVQNSLLFHSGCLKFSVPAELHIYEGGSHGVGLAKNDEALKTWPVLCARWMAMHGWIEQGSRC